MRPIIFILLFVLAATMIVIPALFVMLFNEKQSTSEFQKIIELESDPQKNIVVNVLRTSTQKIESYSLEEYVRGVVAAEMPIDFELEALKAQALAARTYIVKRIIDKNYTDVPNGAMVTDTVKHQVFLSDAELKKLWGYQYNERISKINESINETSGQVITYNGIPINALFFSTRNAYTANSEDYLQKEVPYLRSVSIRWDHDSAMLLGSPYVRFSTKP